MESRNVEVSKILKSLWEGPRRKEPGVDGEEGKEGVGCRGILDPSLVEMEWVLQVLVSSAV
jgi:hypothetical protein